MTVSETKSFGGLQRWLAALPEVVGSVPSIYMVTHNHQEIQFQGNPMPSFDLCGHQTLTWCTYIHVGTTHIHVKINESEKK